MNLDPTDWQAMRDLGHRMVDDMMGYLETVRDRPAWKPVPESTKSLLDQDPPLGPTPAEEVYADFVDHVLPYPLGNIHPRFWGWVIGTGTPLGALAEMLAATMNPNVGGGDHAANYVERQVIEWFKTLFGLPPGASGVLTSGASMANILAIAVARNARAGFDIRHQGLGAAPRKLVFYASVEAHSCVKKAAELLGIGSDNLRLIPVNDRFEIEIGDLKAAVTHDRSEGLEPFAVIGNAGTVNTGALDDLAGLADLCEAENLWFHVDGAIGAVAAISPAQKPLLRGMERADSIAFDFHKWLYVPYEAGCLLVRREPDHSGAFATRASYLASHDRGAAGGEIWYSDYGVELSRGFRALKIWMSLREHGLEKYARMIEQNVAQCRHLERLVNDAPDLELLAPVALNIVCFRYRAPGLDDEALNGLNREILMRLHESGIAVPTYATLGGRYVLRVAHTNHRSEDRDFDLLVAETRRIGAELAASRGVS
ncbi:MAG: pyridoxal-dependent decarboxylase [Spirochaetota bacterium]